MANYSEQQYEETRSSHDVSYDSTIREVTLVILPAVTLVLIGTMSLLGNCLVVIVILKYKTLRSSVNVFVCNLSMSGIVIALLIFLVTINVADYGNSLGYTGCEIWGLVNIVAHVTECYTYALIAMSRYILIAHTHQFEKLLTFHRCVLYSALTWIFGLLMAVGPITGWSAIAYNYKSRCCAYSRAEGISYHYFIVSTSFAVPLIISSVSYVLLYVAVRRSSKRTRITPIETSDNCTQSNCTSAAATIDQNRETGSRREWKLTRMLLLTFIVYAISIGPYSLLNMIDKTASLPEAAHITVVWLLFSNSAINPFVYGLMNKNFRDAYAALICRKGSIFTA